MHYVSEIDKTCDESQRAKGPAPGVSLKLQNFREEAKFWFAHMLDAVVDFNLVKTHCGVEKESKEVEEKHLRTEGKDGMHGNLKYKTHHSVGLDLDEKNANHKEKGDEEKPNDSDEAKDNFIIVHFCIVCNL